MTSQAPGYLTPTTKKIRISDLQKLKGQRPWAMLTAYDYASAKAFDDAGIECLLVGDSAANVVLGYESTTSITVEDMAMLGAAVVRGAKHAFVIIDMPFGSYEASNEQAVTTATTLLRRTGAHMVKLEGGKRIAPRISALKDAGLTVCAHVGFTPQSVNSLGGFRVQGRDDSASTLREDVAAVVAAGADMVVFEMVPAALAAEVTRKCPIPTVGIGAGAGTDAQVLVWHDMAAMYPQGHRPRFVETFGDVGVQLREAAQRYRQAVESGSFPLEHHSFA